MKAVILAGGMGTRLRTITADQVPKPFVRIHGKPVLQYQIENLHKAGIKHIFLMIGYQGNKIKEFFEDGRRFGVNIEYFQEEVPLGTAGALYYIKEALSENFLAIYGDLIFEVDFKRFIDFHEKKRALCTLMVHPNDHPHDSDIVVFNDNKVVTRILKKNLPREEYYSNSVNAGITLFHKTALTMLQEDKKQDLEADVILPLISTERVFAYKTLEYIKDMGTPERYKTVQEHIDKQIVYKRNMINKQKAIFLDRDGTINKHKGFITHPNELELKEEAYAAVRMINQSEYLAIVITNQSVVARNLCSLSELHEIHKKMEVCLGQRAAYIDDIYYCPHHPDKGYPEENRQYKIECDCRKPKIGLILQAAKQYNIDLTASYFIGDTIIDIQTGKNAGMKTIWLSHQGVVLQEIKPDYFAKDLLEAVQRIIR